MPIYYKEAEIELPTRDGGTFPLSNFVWEEETLEIDIKQRTGWIRVRCIPLDDPLQPMWTSIYHNNVTNTNITLNNVINKIKSVITGTIEQ